jgi:hypothetical protein
MNRNGNGNAAATLSDDLVARAQAIASRSDELLDLLDDARQRLVEPPGKPATQRGVKSDPARRTRSSTRPGGIPEGLRVLATQMSVSGANRDEIAKQLQEFGVKDPERILKSMGL